MLIFFKISYQGSFFIKDFQNDILNSLFYLKVYQIIFYHKNYNFHLEIVVKIIKVF